MTLQFVLFLIKFKHRAFFKVHELLSLDTLRFALGFGGFAFVYKSLLCMLRLHRDKKIKGEGDGLNSIVAALAATLISLFDHEDRRAKMALYLFARSSQ